jgi:predicted RNase H-like HicB family nuclease
MKKDFDCVKMMRQIREDLSKRYAGKPDLMMKELREAREHFESRLSRRQSAAVAEAGTIYGSRTKSGGWDLKDYHINIFYSEEDGGYIADIPDLEACSACGETPDKALHEVEIAKEVWLKAAKAAHKRVPPPTLPARHLSTRHSLILS